METPLNKLKFFRITWTSQWVWSGLELKSKGQWTSRRRIEEPSNISMFFLYVHPTRFSQSEGWKCLLLMCSTWWKLYSQLVPNVKASLHYEFGEDLLFGKSLCISKNKKKKNCRSFLSEWIKFFRLDSSHHIVFHVNLISSTETPLMLTAQVLCGSPLNQKHTSNTVVWIGFRSQCRMLFYFLKTAFLASEY